MILGRKYLLLPTPEQQQVFFANAGVARFAYNRCKALSDRYYRVFKKGLSAKKLSTYFTSFAVKPRTSGRGCKAMIAHKNLINHMSSHRKNAKITP